MFLAGGDCPICYDAFTDERPAQVLVCGHVFCASCLDQSNRFRCSICRLDLTHPRCQHPCTYRPVSSHPLLPRPVVLPGNCIECDWETAKTDLSREELSALLLHDIQYQEEKSSIIAELSAIYGSGPLYDKDGLMMPGISLRLHALGIRTKDCDRRAISRLPDPWQEVKEAMFRERW